MVINNSLSHLEDKCRQKFGNRYFGDEGFLKIGDEKEISCKFEVGQLEDGTIILFCDCSVLEILSSGIPSKLSPAIHKRLIMVDRLLPDNQKKYVQLEKINGFEGITSNGFNITGKVSIFIGSYDSSKDPRIRLEYQLKELRVCANQKENIKSVVFDVTNFKLLPEDMKINIEGVKNLTLKKKKEYNNAIKYLEDYKGIRVTCEVIIEIDNEIDLNNIENMVCDLCDLMSISMGTRVQWISYCAYNSEKEFVLRKHASRVTKPYQPMEIILYKNPQAMKTFIESSYVALLDISSINSKILRYDESTAKPIVNAYLDAKAENDYLEGRGIKLVVLMEMLKDSFIKSKSLTQNIIKDEYFNSAKSVFKDELTQAIEKSVDQENKEKSEQDRDALKKEIKDKMFAKITDVNRISFREILQNLCDDINLQVNQDCLQSVVDSRNKLIHEGKFLCKSDNIKKKYQKIEDYPQFQDSEHEYLFLINFIDKCFLKLLGYKGEYLDWSNPEDIHPETLT